MHADRQTDRHTCDYVHELINLFCVPKRRLDYFAQQACLFLRGTQLSVFMFCSSVSSLGVHANSFQHWL